MLNVGSAIQSRACAHTSATPDGRRLSSWLPQVKYSDALCIYVSLESSLEYREDESCSRHAFDNKI